MLAGGLNENCLERESWTEQRYCGYCHEWIYGDGYDYYAHLDSCEKELAIKFLNKNENDFDEGVRE